MALRHNLCPNPAVGVDITGGTPETTWGGDSTPSRVTAIGFERSFAAHYSGGSFARTPRAAITQGDTVSLGMSIRFPTAALNIGGHTYITWYRANGTDLDYDQANFVTNLANVLRVTRAGVVAPAGAAFVGFILDGPSFTSLPLDATALLVEQGDVANAYADGDTSGWGWDGTAGLSTSSEIPVSTGLPGRVSGVQSAAGSVVAATARGLIGAVT